MSSKTEYYPWFDWLRGILAIVVVFSHEGLLGWQQSGNFAVQVFFALSGWLIGGILLGLTPHDLPRFYFNRAIRIWVPYYLALMILLGVSVLRDRINGRWLEFSFYKGTFVFNLFGLPMLDRHRLEAPLAGTGGHFWTVNAEEQFYLLAPLLLVLTSRSFSRSPGIWTVLGFLTWIFHCYASITLGVFAAVLASRYGQIHRHLFVRLAIMMIAIVTVVGLVITTDDAAPQPTLGYQLFAPLCAITIVLSLAIPGRQGALGKLVGGMSYPLYLNHWIGIYIANGLFKSLRLEGSWMKLLFSLSVNVGFSLFLYWFVDRQLLRDRNRMYTPRRGQIAAVIGYGLVAVGVIVGLSMLALRENG